MITQKQVQNWVQEHSYLWHDANEYADPFDLFYQAAYTHLDKLDEEDRETFLEHLREELV